MRKHRNSTITRKSKIGKGNQVIWGQPFTYDLVCRAESLEFDSLSPCSFGSFAPLRCCLVSQTSPRFRGGSYRSNPSTTPSHSVAPRYCGGHVPGLRPVCSQSIFPPF